MKAGLLNPSKFLKKDDVENPVLVTIKALRQTNVAQDDKPEEMKWTMLFRELDKPLVLNSTNIQLCTLALGTDETDEWIGRQIVLYNDPSISFAGKITGGIRLRAPKKKAAANAPPQEEELDDEIPF